jgi:hypothetical protein
MCSAEEKEALPSPKRLFLSTGKEGETRNVSDPTGKQLSMKFVSPLITAPNVSAACGKWFLLLRKEEDR